MNVKELLKVIAALEDDGKDEGADSLDGRFPFWGKVAIRTVTHYYTGEVVAVRGGFVKLVDGAWIADTGRWSEFVAKGTYNEAEACGDVAVNIGAIVDVVPWAHKLPVTK